MSMRVKRTAPRSTKKMRHFALHGTPDWNTPRVSVWYVQFQDSHILGLFGRYGPRRLRLQLSVPTKLIETNKHKKTAVKQRSELLNYLLQHADFVSSGCSATRRKFLSATQQK